MEVISCNELVVRSELDVFVAVVRWFMRRVTCGVREEPKDETAKETNEDLAIKVLSLFVEYEFVEPSLTENRPLLFEGDGSAELNTNECFELDELFACVDINKLSIGDLQRVGRLCRELCKETGTNYEIELVPVRKFGEKVVEKLLELDNDIPNISMELYARILHGRNDLLFTFSHRFHAPQGANDRQVSPEFADPFSKGKWRLRLDFPGVRRGLHDESAWCFLHRTSENSAAEEHIMFTKQSFVDFGNSSNELERMVYSRCTERNDTRWDTGSDAPARGTVELIPSSVFFEKNTVRVGVIIYFKPSDNHQVIG